MIPIVTPARMAEIDEAAAARIDELIDRAGRAVALTALAMLGGTYGRRVIVLAGPGNNGADGRVAAHHLRRRGVRVEIVDALAAPSRLATTDLVIDAACGNGLRRPDEAPTVERGTPVLAVDIPSGIDGLTGVALGRPLRADRTVTFAALKPGLVLEPGRSVAGTVEVVDIGLDPGEVRTHAVTDADVAEMLADRPADDHKWRSGVRIVGGSPGMTGAAALAARSAQRVGAGIVQLAMPGARGAAGPGVVGNAARAGVCLLCGASAGRPAPGPRARPREPPNRPQRTHGGRTRAMGPRHAPGRQPRATAPRARSCRCTRTSSRRPAPTRQQPARTAAPAARTMHRPARRPRAG